MDAENTIIKNYANALTMATNDVYAYAGNLNDNPDESRAVVATLNVMVESVRSHTVLLQQALDKYK